LTLARIAESAVAVAHAEGLGAVSMARVAERLGVSTMSLYRYVAAKDELLALMVDAALGEPPDLLGETGWREGLATWAWAYHDRIQEHPWTLRVPISGPPIAPNSVAWLDRALAALTGTGLAEDEKASVVLVLSGYVRNEGTLTADLTAAGPVTDAVMSGYANTLRALAPPERFPALHALLAAGVFDRADPPEHEFRFGLERILDGVEVLIDRRRARAD
jgi:AcrR family transcriptional regulator